MKFETPPPLPLGARAVVQRGLEDPEQAAAEFEGGMGLVWLLVGLPLLVPFVIGAWKRNRMLFWTFLVPLGLLFAILWYYSERGLSRG